MLTEQRGLSPASSLASLPSDDLSDFSDSDFDIISSSDSTRSHEEDIGHPLSEGHFSDDEIDLDHAISDSFLLDRESYRVIDPDRQSFVATDVTTDALLHERAPIDHAAASTVLSEEDASVMDALSQSLERSTESIIGNSTAATTPISASVANVHFITSPGTVRRASSGSRSRILSMGDNAPSPSSSVLKLAFPDPLSSSSDSSMLLPARDVDAEVSTEAPIAEIEPEMETREEPGSLAPHQDEQELVEFALAPAEDVATAPVALIASVEVAPKEEKTDYYISDADEKPEHAAVSEMAQVIHLHRAAHPFEAFDDYVARMSKHFINTVTGNRWTASVLVSILALVIGGVMYFSTPVTPSPTPSSVFMLPPSTTTPLPVLGLLVNKSSSLPQAQAPSPPATGTGSHAAGPVKDGSSMNVFVPWALSPAPVQGSGSETSAMPPQSVPRGVKRKRNTASASSAPSPSESVSYSLGSLSTPGCSASTDGWVPTFAQTIDAALPTLTIDATTGTVATKGISATSSSSKDPSASRAVALPLLDPQAMFKYLPSTHRAQAQILYDALRSDIEVLTKALDELIHALEVHTRSASSAITHAASRSLVEIDRVTKRLEKTREEVIYRHSRAKYNARKIRAKGKKVFGELKEAAKKGKGKEALRGVVNDVVSEVVKGAKGKGKEVMKSARAELIEIVDEMKEGFRQGLKVRKSSFGSYGSGGAFGSSGGDRSDETSSSMPSRFGRARKNARMLTGKENADENEGFLSRKKWSGADGGGRHGCATCGARRRRDRDL